MWTLALAALALVVAGGEANASYSGIPANPRVNVSVSSVAGGEASERHFDQRGLISPPAAIDPGMALAPPDDRGRLRIIQPPGTLDDGLHLK